MLVYTCNFLHYEKHIQVCFGLDMHYVCDEKKGRDWKQLAYKNTNFTGIISIIEIIFKKNEWKYL